MDIHLHIVSGGTGTFAQMIHAANPIYFPVAECGGIGGLVVIATGKITVFPTIPWSSK